MPVNRLAWGLFVVSALLLGVPQMAGAQGFVGLVKDINPSGDAAPSSLVVFNGAAFFSADDGTSGAELWKTDGTEAGTVQVKDINPAGSSSPGGLTVVGSTLFFAADDGSSGVELWKSDGSEVGTVLVKDITSGVASSQPERLTAAGATLYFRASDPANGSELWKSDGTGAGTVLVENINLYSGGAPEYLTLVGSEVFFRADDGAYGRELWKSDGTGAGTDLVKDINVGDSAWPSRLTEMGGKLYFRASDGIAGSELWVSDGTDAGTLLVADIRSGSSSSPDFLTNVNGTLFFTANDGTNGTELWQSDGTEAGTALVKDIWDGGDSYPQHLTTLDGVLFFSALDSGSGVELWRSDGTEAGTVLVKNIHPAGSSYPLHLVGLGETLYFTADDGSHGQELWRSDGTAAGTALVEDLLAGTSGSAIAEPPIMLGDTVLFAADDGVNGSELRKIASDNSPPVAGTAVSDAGDFASDNTQLGFSWSGFSDPDTGIAEFRVALGTVAEPELYVSFVALSGDASQYIFGGSVFADGTYLCTVRALNAGGTPADATVSVVVDASPPTEGEVTAEQGSVTTQVDDLTFSWSGFADAESGLAHYEIAFGAGGDPESVLPFTVVGLGTSSHTFSGGPYADGEYTFTLRAVNQAGGNRDIPVLIALDSTPPSTGTVVSQGGAATSDDGQLVFSWSGFSDAGTGIEEYFVALGSAVDPEAYVPFTVSGTSSLHIFSAGPYTHGQLYTCTVVARDLAANTASASGTVFVDTTPPSPGTVASATGDYAVDGSALQFTWSGFADPDTGIVDYEAALGDGSDPDAYVSFTSAGAGSNEYTFGPGPFSDGLYVCTVRGYNLSGSVAEASAQVSLDSVPPQAGLVTAEAGAYSDDDSQLAFSWSGFSDAGTGLKTYYVALGNASEAEALQPFTAVPIATTTQTFTDGPYASGQSYLCTVVAQDLAGGTSYANASTFIDATAPAAGTVTPLDGAYLSANSMLRFSWAGFGDPESGILDFRVALGTPADPTGIVPFTSLGPTANQVALVDGPYADGPYLFTVRAQNPTGATTDVSANVGVDTVPPSAGTFSNAGGPFSQVQTSLSFSWAGFGDAGSGLDYYEIALGTQAAPEFHEPFTSLPTSATLHDFTNGPFGSGRYYGTLRAVDRAGLQVEVQALAQVDTSPPEAGSVQATTGDYTNSTTELEFTWSGFEDPHSGIDHYEVALGDIVNPERYQAFTAAAPAAPPQTFAGSYVVGQAYLCTVRAHNGAGGSVEASASVTVDPSKPLAGTVTSQTGSYTSDSSALSFSWADFTGGDTIITAYHVALGDGDDPEAYVPFTELAPTQSSHTFDGPFSQGVLYVCVVVVENANGQTASAGTGVKVDTTAPELGTLVSATGDFTENDTSLIFLWEGFTDLESGIDAYEVALGTAAAPEALFPFATLAPDVAGHTFSGTFVNGQAYLCTLRARNGAGLTASTTASVTVDVSGITAGTVVSQAGGYTDDNSALVFEWDGFSAGGSGLAGYHVALGDGLDPEAHHAFVALAPTLRSHAFDQGPYADGDYLCTVVAENGVGQTDYVAASVVIDTVPPTPVIGSPSTYFAEAGPVTYGVLYPDDATVLLSLEDISLVRTGSAEADVSLEDAKQMARVVVLDNLRGDGTLGIAIAGGSAVDLAGNEALAAGPSEVFDVGAPAELPLRAWYLVPLLLALGWAKRKR